MSVTQTETISISSDTGTGLSGRSAETGTTEQTFREPYPAGSTDVEYDITFSHTTLKKIFLVSDQDMTIKTNSSGSPSQTISLKAGRPLRWGASEGYFTNPITADVTKFFISCTSSSTLKGLILN